MRSHTLTQFSVPTATHCNFGLKAMVLMVEPASKALWESFKSMISQTYNFLSFPPVAKYFPFGEMEMLLTLASWALKVYLI